MNVIDRALPFNLEAERAVLGAVLIHESAWVPAATVLTGRDFFRDAHRRVWEAMERLAEAKSTPSDVVLLVAELKRVGDLDEIGGAAYLMALTNGLPHATNVKHYARLVREQAQLRALIFEANRVLADAYEAERPSALVVESAVRGMLALARPDEDAQATAKEAVDRYMADMVADKVLAALPTQFAELDALVGGLTQHELTLVAARPSVGKSSLSLRMAARMAAAGTPTAFFSLEMSREQLAAQLMAWRSRVPSEDVRRRRMTEAQYAAVSQAWTETPDVPLFLRFERTLSQVVAACRQLKAERGLQCVMIDYIQKLVTGGRHESRQLEVAHIAHALKALAQDEALAVVALAQLSRPDKARRKQDQRPLLSDLRESGALEQDAYMALLLYRPEMHGATEENRGIAEVIVAKNRMGPTGTVRLYFNKELAKFQDLAPPA